LFPNWIWKFHSVNFFPSEYLGKLNPNYNKLLTPKVKKTCFNLLM
jgi:hypothetical protein